MRRTIISFAFCLLLPALVRAESLYVACDNGIDCVMAPCPSTTVRDLAAGSDRKGVYPDIGGLSESDQKRIRDTDALYYGRLVLRGRVEDRAQKISGRQHTLPMLVVTGIEREATPDERKHCPAG